MCAGTRVRRDAFTLIELLVVVAIIALLISILLPSLAEAREQGKRVKCAANLRSIGQAVANCWNDNKGYNPNWDDGEQAARMLTWVDCLYDMDYTANLDVTFCPSDTRHDGPMVARGGAWGQTFVDHFDVKEPIKPGVRTSYAINCMMHFNWPSDRYKDAGRQIFGMDGWWTWHGNINATWLFNPGLDPVNTPTWNGAMHAWRHGKRYMANILFCDAHVEAVAPRRPARPSSSSNDGTVDTSRMFTWLPGEQTSRVHWEPYLGDVTEWNGRVPAVVSGQGRFLEGESTFRFPVNYPDELNTNYRTFMKKWRKLPNEPGRRM